MNTWSRLSTSKQGVTDKTVQQREPVTKQESTPNPFPGASPAATEEEQVLDSGYSGVCILTSDQVAVQHHMHGVGFTGYDRGHKP